MGIWVMSEVEDPGTRNGQVYIIAAIGLCARDGKRSQVSLIVIGNMTG